MIDLWKCPVCEREYRGNTAVACAAGHPATLWQPVPDPYEAFFNWCLANGFRDVSECEPEQVDTGRMNEAIAAYGRKP